jgi:hypothetical protein
MGAIKIVRSSSSPVSITTFPGHRPRIRESATPSDRRVYGLTRSQRPPGYTRSSHQSSASIGQEIVTASRHARRSADMRESGTDGESPLQVDFQRRAAAKDEAIDVDGERPLERSRSSRCGAQREGSPARDLPQRMPVNPYAHDERKYPETAVLLSSEGRRWSGVAAGLTERTSRPSGSGH